MWGKFVSGLAICLLCGLLCTGCGTFFRYSGIHIENTEQISEVIRTTMLHRSNSVKVTFRAFTLDRSEIEEIIDSLMAGAFAETGDPKCGDYLRYQYGGYELRHSVEEGTFRYTYHARITPVYYTTAKQEAWVDEKIQEIISDLPLSEDASEFERIRCVRDYICKNVSYDTVHKHTPGSGHIQSTAYGALFYHTALCQGYAVLCYRLLKELGVDIRIVTGDAVVSEKAERHAWNLVGIDGSYYNLDVTLDDVFDTEDYFLKADADFADDHVRDEEYRSDTFYREYPMSKESYQK